jgi:ribosomal-protein-alanine N-acetyltransferase
MTAADIPQVMDIERESFPSMWPQTAYKRELKNRLARYMVLVEDSADDLPPQGEAAVLVGSPWRRAMRRLLRNEPEPPPTRELIVGLIGLWLMVDQAHIVTIAVREVFRRRGAGELLLIAAIELALANGMDAVTLEYRRSNLAARALYEKYGFLNAGLRRRYYSDTKEDAIIMTTPPLFSRSYQEKYQRLRQDHQERCGHLYSLPDAW